MVMKRTNAVKIRRARQKIRIITAILALFLMACGRKEQTEGGDISAERVKKGAESARNTLEKAQEAESGDSPLERIEDIIVEQEPESDEAAENAADTAETEAGGASAKGETGTAVEQETVGETETAGEQETGLPDNVILAHITENIKYTDEKIETQYTDDLSFLADLKDTNSNYAYQDGKVYYRRYHEDSFEDAALWGDYGALPDKEKEIVCIDADGSGSVVFTDKGSGSIYLLNDRFYMTDFIADENGYSGRRLYSVDMRGNSRIDYGDAEIYVVDTERKLLILERIEEEHSHKYTEYSYSYCIVNYETGEEKPLSPDTHSNNGYIDIEDYQNGWIYYVNHYYDENHDFSKLCAVSVEGEQREIIALTSAHNQESKRNGYGYRENILDVKADGDRLYFIFGGYDGTAHIFQGGKLISVKLDGTDYKAVEIDEDAFYLSHDKGKSLVYFPPDYEYVQAEHEAGLYYAMVWDVEADKCYHSDFPENLLYAYSGRTGFIGQYCPADKSVLCGVTTSEIITDGAEKRWRRQTGVYVIPDDSGRVIRLVADIEQYTVKWQEEEAEYITYEDFYYADGFLYFKAEYNTYDKESSIGWRDGCRRLHTDMCRLKIGESKAEILYSY